MKILTLFAPVLVLCLCLLFVSSVYSAKPQPLPPTYVSYYGYAMLYDNISPNNPYMIASDGKGQYVDRSLAKGNPNNKRGDRIGVWLKYNGTGYDLTSFECFLGKPELPWRSDRRVHLNFDIASGTPAASEINQTLANMLLYNVTNNLRRGDLFGAEYHLTDNSVHIAFVKGTVGNDPNEISAIILIDKSDIASDPGGDPEAITQTNLWKIDSSAPRYWTSLEGVASGNAGEIDTHDHIGFFIFKYQLNFRPIENDEIYGKIPITWEVTPMQGTVSMYVRRVTDITNPAYSYVEEPLWTFPSFPFRLIVSKNSLTGRTFAPPKQPNTIDAWGRIKSEY